MSFVWRGVWRRARWFARNSQWHQPVGRTENSAAGRADVAASADAKGDSASASAAAVDPKKAASDPVLKVMQTELARANSELGKTDQAPYYLSYTVYDQDYVVLVGAYGSLLTDAAAKTAAGGRNDARGLACIGQYAWAEPVQRRYVGTFAALGRSRRYWAGALGIDGPGIQAGGSFTDECANEYGGARGRRR